MLARSLAFKQLFRFCTKGPTTDTVTNTTSESLIQAG